MEWRKLEKYCIHATTNIHSKFLLFARTKFSDKNCLQTVLQITTMLIIGGYLLTYNQLYQLGLRRGLVIENGEAHILNNDFEKKGIKFIYAWPVAYPRATPTTEGVPGILICTRRRDDHLERLADCKPFEVNEDDLKVKKWLENHGIKDVPFVAVPDPLFKYDEFGSAYD